MGGIRSELFVVKPDRQDGSGRVKLTANRGARPPSDYVGAMPATPPLRRQLRWLGPVCWALFRRPALIPVAVRQSLRLAPRGWWKQWPPLPLPADDYLRFRSLTAYGDADHPPDPGDVITWLSWSRTL